MGERVRRGRRGTRAFGAATAVLVGMTVLSPSSPAQAPPDADGPAPVAERAPLPLTTLATPPGTLPAERAAVPEDRYALAGGCYAVRSVGADRFVARDGTGGFAATAPTIDGAEPFRFQATDLGRYLLHGTVADFLAFDGRATTTAGPNADWTLTDSSDGTFRLAMGDPGDGQLLAVTPAGGLTMADGEVAAAITAGFDFRLTDGCATFPEVELNVEGPHVAGASPTDEVAGYVDAHLHVTAYEFLGGMVHCGRPWSAYGVADALVDCPDHTIADGAGAVLENFLSGATIPVANHDPIGWPTFRDWPAPGSLTHEQVYYRWLERAWRGGLRIMVNLFTDNRVLCEIYPLKRNSCDEMDSVRLQIERTRELERYIDAQNGGPGEGWFRVVDDPYEARQVANEGKLAVVLGIEVSEPLGCRIYLGMPQCTEAQIDAQLDELHALGIRQLVVIHKFDNAFGGVAGDGGTKGVVINLGNFYGTGRFWDFETCDPDDTGVHDNDQSLPLPELNAVTSLAGGILALFGGAGGALPIYPEPHHCNTLGLSPLGAYAIREMVERDMIVDVDHMSVRARQQALDVLEAEAYSGVISSHSWATPDAYPRVYDLGGFTAPYAGDSRGFAGAWRDRREAADPRYPFGIGFGADANGLGAQGSPRGAGVENPVTYPFEGLGGVTIDQQVSGRRTYDVNVDGVAHYGLYPDWIEDLRQLEGDAIVEDLARGSEAYLEMWERADGVPASAAARGAACPGPEGDASAGLSGLVVGMTAEEVLRAVGQPDERRGATFRYCDLAVTFDGTGRLAAATGATGARGPTGAGGHADPAGPAYVLGSAQSISLPATGGPSPALWVGGVATALAIATLAFSRVAAGATGSRPSGSTAATAASRRSSPSPRR